jgi:hypothetical protein
MATICRACGAQIPTIGNLRYNYCPHRATCQAEMINKQYRAKEKYRAQARVKERMARANESLKLAERKIAKKQAKRICRKCGNPIDNGNWFYCSICHSQLSEELNTDYCTGHAVGWL